jgi:hypothetical protein
MGSTRRHVDWHLTVRVQTFADVDRALGRARHMEGLSKLIGQRGI